MLYKTFYLAAIMIFTLPGNGLADELKITLQPPWQMLKDAGGSVEYALKYPGTGWPSLTSATPLKPDCHYMLKWRMKSSIADVSAPFIAVIDAGVTYNFSYLLTPGWSQYAAYFYSDTATAARLRLYINPGEAKEIQVRDLQLIPVTAEMFTGNLLPDGDFESGSGFPANWTKTYGTTVNPAAIIESQNFLAGTGSMVLSACEQNKGTAGINSVYLPVIPGKRFELTFWAKADADMSLAANVDGWSPVKHTGKHFYKGEKVKLSPEWRQYSITVDIPASLSEYPDLNSRMMRLSFTIPQSKTKEVWIDGVIFRQIK
jgi:hypothetical protein